MQEYLYSIINTFNDKLFVVDEDGIFVDYISTIESSGDLLTSVNDFLGKHFSESLPPEISSQLNNKLSEVIINGTNVKLEYSIFVGGSTQWYKAIISEIQPSDKRRFLLSVRDITDYKTKELFLKNILDNSVSVIMSFKAIRNDAGKIIDLEWTSLNKAAMGFMNKKDVELVGKSLVDETPEKDSKVLLEKYKSVIETGNTLDFEYCCDDIEKEKTYWLKIVGVKFEDGLIVTFEDITKRKSLELEAEHRIKIQVVLRKLASNFINVRNTDIDNVINKSIAEIGEFVEVDRVYIFDYLFDKNIMRNTHEWCAEGIRPEIQNLQFVPCDMLPEWVNAHKNNEIIYIKNVCDLEEGSYIRDLLISQDIKSLITLPLISDNECIGFVGFDAVNKFKSWNEDELSLLKLFADLLVSVKLKIKYEQILKENEQKYKNLAENMSDMVAVHEKDGTFVYISPSCKPLLGYNPDELIGKNPFEFIHPDDLKLVRELYSGDHTQISEYRFRKKSGNYIWFETNTNTIKDSIGKVTYLQTISRDVTKRLFSEIEIRNLNEELVELNVQKNKLFSIIAHDLRSPIASTQSILNIVKDDFDELSKEEMQEYISELKLSSSNTLELLEDLLLWSSSQLDKVSYKPESIVLSKIVVEAAANLTTMASVKNISIVNKVKNGLLIESDASMLKTIIRNLVSNAIKYSYTNGVVTVSSKVNDKNVIVSVEDKGVGIKEEDKSKIFNKTVNFTTYGTINEKGSGIGLDLCEDFIKKMKSEIWFESEYGKGTTFYFTLKKL